MGQVVGMPTDFEVADDKFAAVEFEEIVVPVVVQHLAEESELGQISVLWYWEEEEP